jgi:predicted AlkP superfamily pyrophosphatase or phosphodiesterase
MDIGFRDRIDEVVKWFLKFQMDFSTLYFDEPDTTGHAYGPLSNEYKNKVTKIKLDCKLLE